MAAPRTRSRIVDALLALAAERPWQDVTVAEIAERAGTTLATLREAYDGRMAILADFIRSVDQKVLAGLDPDMRGEAPRERLFDVLFARFEHLAPHRAAVRSIAAGMSRDPLAALELNRIVTNSMAWMLSAAGIAATGPGGLVRMQGLALIWAQVLRVWLDDDDPGLARTMAELDRRLRRAERMAVRLDRMGRLFRREGAAKPDGKPRPDESGEGEAEAHPS